MIKARGAWRHLARKRGEFIKRVYGDTAMNFRGTAKLAKVTGSLLFPFELSGSSRVASYLRTRRLSFSLALSLSRQTLRIRGSFRAIYADSHVTHTDERANEQTSERANGRTAYFSRPINASALITQLTASARSRQHK